MTDLVDLQLFSGIPVAEPSPIRNRHPQRRNLFAELVPTSAELIAFPPSRDTRLVADLARIFLSLRERHGRRCRAMLVAKRFKPIAVRLRRLGVPAAVIERELAQLEAAVARSVWRRDGCPTMAPSGGHAA